ncbi:MAG: Do family serine endopeptidase [Gammaproteobacteria bacterium]
MKLSTTVTTFGCQTKRTIAGFGLMFVFLVPEAAPIAGLPDFTDLVNENRAAVVNIGTIGTRRPARERPRMRKRDPGIPGPEMPGEDSPLQDFFQRFFGEEPPGGNGGAQRHSSLGSGFIISDDGYVISNYHVVREADQVIVRLSDRREYVAKVVGMDPRSDIAVLKVEADRPLPNLKLGKSSSLEVGEWVLAIGSPFGFDHSVTAGIVSAKGRSLPNENYVPFIQTDVAINPGNSGGPLFNLDGEVVGVNSQIYSRTGGFMGLSFAIPIDVVLDVYTQLRDKGSVTRGWLGVLIQDVTRELAESFQMKKPHGALVSKVLPDSPAAAAGFKAGDVIVEFNNQKIDTSASLPPLVGTAPVGGKTPVKVMREGSKKLLEVQIGELPSDDELQLTYSSGDKNQ